MFYLGIDIAKTNHVASLIDSEGNTLGKPIKFTNSKEGYEKLISSIHEFVKDNCQVLVGMEATGHYWLSLFSALEDDCFNMSVFNPIQIKSFRESFTIRKKKNDLIDSLIIAHFVRTFGSNSSSLETDDFMSLKQLTRYRSSLVQNTSSLKVKIIGLLDKVFPEYSTLFSDVFGQASKQILLNCNTPNDILNFNTKKLSNMLSQASNGRFKKDKVLEIKALAKNSFGIKIMKGATSFEIKQLVNQIIFIEEQIKDLDKEIEPLFNKFNTHLLTIPGIGKTLAPIILAEIGDINKFSTPNKLVAFAGCDPTENQSGNSNSTNEKTSKRGSPYLRHALHTAALVATNNDDILKAYYDKKKSEGKHHNVALASISRKLLLIIYAVLKENRDYHK